MGCMSEKNNAVNDSLPADTSSIPYLMCIGKRSRKGVFMAKNKKGADGRYRYRIYLGKADDGSKKFKSF